MVQVDTQPGNGCANAFDGVLAVMVASALLP
jgi:L-cystine uptake protein TcyP (sodium:dicarboxylate symporter family)